jgi:hypothetical protein
MKRVNQVKQTPEFKPMGSQSFLWGRCRCCGGPFGDFRVKVSFGADGPPVAFICLKCAQALESEDRGFNP